MSDPIRMPASYDSWATAGPPEHVMVCPECGHDAEDMAELEVKGLEGRGLLSYPLYIYDSGAKNETRYLGGAINPARERAYFVTIYRCECGLILTDDALVTEEEFHRP